MHLHFLESVLRRRQQYHIRVCNIEYLCAYPNESDNNMRSIHYSCQLSSSLQMLDAGVHVARSEARPIVEKAPQSFMIVAPRKTRQLQ